MIDQLKEVRDLAKNKIASGDEPPWASYQYKKLVETVDAILGGMNSVTTKEKLPQSGQQQDPSLWLVDFTYCQGTARLHPDTIPVLMPN